MNKKLKEKDLGIVKEPKAWITVQKNRKKVYSERNEVYLRHGENFEIEIFNPTKIAQLCKIRINGNYISSSGLVLNPGQRWFLDRYIDSPKKFIFRTYEIENSEEAIQAVEENGDIEIEFYPGIFINTILDSSGDCGNNRSPYNPLPYYPCYPSIQPDTWRPNEIWYSQNIGTYPAGSMSTFTSISQDLSDFTFTSIGDISTNYINTSNSTIETGRIQEGDKSDQTFEGSSGSFSTISFNTIRYKILPESRKEFINPSELRSYCTSCGNRIRKSTWEFCPKCGEKITK